MSFTGVVSLRSPGVGAMVAKAASDSLTPVVLELGGKDPFVVCDDVNVGEIIQTACRGVWQNMGSDSIDDSFFKMSVDNCY